jgi:ketosteroid isomerase-like protein
VCAQADQMRQDPQPYTPHTSLPATSHTDQRSATIRRVNKLPALRHVYREWELGNYRAGLELYDPRMTLEVHNPIPDAGVYEGLAGLQRYMRRFLATWKEYETRAVGFRAEGDRVVVHVHHGGLGRASGVRTEMSYFTVWTFLDDRVVRVDIAADDDVALRTARRGPASEHLISALDRVRASKRLRGQ